LVEEMVSRVAIHGSVSGILCVGLMNYVGAAPDRTAMTCAGVALLAGTGAGVGAWGGHVVRTTSWRAATLENYMALERVPGSIARVGVETLGPPAAADLAQFMGPVMGYTAAIWTLFFGLVF